MVAARPTNFCCCCCCRCCLRRTCAVPVACCVTIRRLPPPNPPPAKLLLLLAMLLLAQSKKLQQHPNWPMHQVAWSPSCLGQLQLPPLLPPRVCRAAAADALLPIAASAAAAAAGVAGEGSCPAGDAMSGTSAGRSTTSSGGRCLTLPLLLLLDAADALAAAAAADGVASLVGVFWRLRGKRCCGSCTRFNQGCRRRRTPLLLGCWVVVALLPH